MVLGAPFGGKVIPGPCPQPGTHYNSRYVCLTHTPAHMPHLHPGPGKLLADLAHVYTEASRKDTTVQTDRSTVPGYPGRRLHEKSAAPGLDEALGVSIHTSKGGLQSTEMFSAVQLFWSADGWGYLKVMSLNLPGGHDAGEVPKAQRAQGLPGGKGVA